MVSKIMSHQHVKFTHGFTLLELLVCISIASILLLIGVPMFNNSINSNRTKLVTEILLNDIKFAQSEALKKQATITVSFKTGTNWCYGISDSGDCNCSVSNSCRINGTNFTKSSSEFNVTDMQLTSLPAGAYSNYIFTIDGLRGVFNSSGNITYRVSDTSNSAAATVKIERAGHTSVCGTISGYVAC